MDASGIYLIFRGWYLISSDRATLALKKSANQTLDLTAGERTHYNMK
jgi:hypothetical protein